MKYKDHCHVSCVLGKLSEIEKLHSSETLIKFCQTTHMVSLSRLL
jgi:hypothetical protein